MIFGGLRLPGPGFNNMALARAFTARKRPRGQRCQQGRRTEAGNLRVGDFDQLIEGITGCAGTDGLARLFNASHDVAGFFSHAYGGARV